MKSSFDLLIEKQVLSKFGLSPAYVQFIGGFDVTDADIQSIDKLILGTELNLEKIMALPFDNNMSAAEVNLYEVQPGVYITIWYSNELWADPVVLNIYRTTQIPKLD